MRNTFYINYDEKRDWYMLCIKDTHFSVSCGDDLDKILAVLSDYVKRYRTHDRLITAMSQLESKGVVAPKTFAQREEYYKEHGEDYAKLITRVVDSALKEAREWDKEHSLLAQTKKRLKKSGIKKTIEDSVKKEDTKTTRTTYTERTTPFRPKILSRKRLVLTT